MSRKQIPQHYAQHALWSDGGGENGTNEMGNTWRMSHTYLSATHRLDFGVVGGADVGAARHNCRGQFLEILCFLPGFSRGVCVCMCVCVCVRERESKSEQVVGSFVRLRALSL